MAMDPMVVAAQSQAGAAWVQAIFTIVAIVATSVIAILQSIGRGKKEARDRELLAKDHAIALLPQLKKWNQDAREWIGAMNHPDDLGEWAAIATYADSDEAYELPVALIELRGRYRELGSAAEAVQKAVITNNALRDLRPQIRKLWSDDKMEAEKRSAEAPIAIKAIRGHMGAVASAYAAIEKIYRS